ncbi:MAG: L-glutamate gamma-semialdehyde dehydrogenase [Deltaproteobacteria bacterium]|nr:L-glutamate gamma-semialdehyde dehydrogenase [Deltaproteobacteria bacterium]
MSMNGRFRVPEPINEQVLAYGPGSAEKKALKARLREMGSETVEIPVIVGGRELRTGRLSDIRAPHAHQRVLGRYHQAGAEEAELAIRSAREARRDWAALPFHERAAVFLRAADLLAGSWRSTINAATMLGQSKTVHQAEIDAACESIDFWRYNPVFAQRLYEDQPAPTPQRLNRVEYRPLEGFVFAITPFNFTSIAANLPTAPALMGNTVLWKPASTAVLSAYWLMRVLEAAGLPPGVINFLPGPVEAVGGATLASPELAGVHFTGSTSAFRQIWRTVGENIGRYRSYPRLVGETGGKGFVFAHPSADPETLAVALVRGAFEYQGQKCSAASRAYVPESLWPQVKERLLGMLSEIKVGDVEDFTHFMGAVIDETAFRRIQGYIEHARSSSSMKIVFGGRCDEASGYFIGPTVVQTTDPRSRLMQEEIFGPVLTLWVYPDAKVDEALELVDTTTPYALTGAIFARERREILRLTERLQGAAGNFYINDKPTGAVVGQQPFGGARASGTNDKAGSPANLLRWTSLRTVSESFSPPTTYHYPFLAER